MDLTSKPSSCETKLTGKQKGCTKIETHTSFIEIRDFPDLIPPNKTTPKTRCYTFPYIPINPNSNAKPRKNHFDKRIGEVTMRKHIACKPIKEVDKLREMPAGSVKSERT